MHLFLECIVCLVGWDHQPYFCEENQQGKTYARHGGFIEAQSRHHTTPSGCCVKARDSSGSLQLTHHDKGAELFDLTYFGLGTAEAGNMTVVDVRASCLART